jgi:hypothetical protein
MTADQTFVLIDAQHSDAKRIDAFLGVGMWLLFIALLIPAGVVGWVIGNG